MIVRFTIATWNINSVRLRIDQVRRFLEENRPDVLCLQETKCPDDRFPLKTLRSFGYPHIAHTGQKGYNGVAVLSRFAFESSHSLQFCGRNDARHLSVTLGFDANGAAGLAIHNFYVPAGGDIPDPALNWKFAHKLDFLAEMRAWDASARSGRPPSILVGDLNVAPLEHDVWNHKRLLAVVSHTPAETETLETLRREGRWIDAMRVLRPEPEKLFTWWSYRSPDWQAADKGRRLDHVWHCEALRDSLRAIHISRPARGWERPSDHVPVTATFEL